jgi:hypothetical protein
MSNERRISFGQADARRQASGVRHGQSKDKAQRAEDPSVKCSKFLISARADDDFKFLLSNQK